MKVEFIIEEGTNNFGAYREENGSVIATMGDNMAALLKNIAEAYNLYAEEAGKPAITEDDITTK